jgi:elongation factor P
MKNVTDVRGGMVVRLEGDLYKVLHAEFHAGGGKMHGNMHAKLRKISTGHVFDKRFRHDEKFEEVTLDKQVMTYLYDDADFCVFMHPETYEQVTLPKESLGAFFPFLKPDQEVQVELFEGQPLEVSTPSSVELVVSETPEGLHGDDSNVFKEATLENEMEVMVPQFIKPGDRIRLDVETRKYVERIR